MRYLLISHTPFLFDEFPFGEQMVFRNETFTATRTKAFSEALQSLGESARINLTLWMLVTDATPEDVLNRLKERLRVHLEIEDAGDILIIETPNFVGYASNEAIAQVKALSKIEVIPNKSTSSITEAPSILTSYSSSKTGRNEWFEKLAKLWGVKSTDALIRRVPGSFESGKR